MFRAQAVTKKYGDIVALSNLTFAVESGEAIALLGPNGAGKSTLFSLIAGLATPTSGEATKESLISVGYAPQELGIYPLLTVQENLELFARLGGLDAEDGSVSATVECMALHNILARPCRHLSVGQQRRVHAAIAMIGAPDLVLLDEPTVGVDFQTRLKIVEGIAEIPRSGRTLVYATHYLEEIDGFATRVIVLDGGRLVFDGSMTEFRNLAPNRTIRVRARIPAADEDNTADGKETVIQLRDQSELQRAIEKLSEQSGELIGVDVGGGLLDDCLQVALSA